MTLLETYFQHIVIINRDVRTDRWEKCIAQLNQLGIENYERFSGIDHAVINGHALGNPGCTSSHRCVLDAIVFNRWPRTLILEDDFEVLYPDLQDRFQSMIGEVPEDWDMLYLGGHYAEKPQARVSQHVIRIGHMMTTSSYAVTYKMARTMAPHIYGSAPIDTLYYGFHRSHKCYIFQPRLMAQWESHSDLEGIVTNNHGPMTDTVHENMV